MNAIDVISFDLFNTLVYVEYPPSFSFKQSLEKIWKLLDGHSIELPFETFFKAYVADYKAKQRELLSTDPKPRYHELTLQLFISNVLTANGYERSPELDEIAHRMAESYFQGSLDYVYLYPGVHELLLSLKEQEYVLVMTSDHSWPPNGHDILEKYSLGNYFTKVVFSGEVGYRKPSPVIFEKAIGELSSREQLLHVGDSYYNDVRGVIEFGGEAIWIDSWTDESYKRFGLERPELTAFEKTKIRAIIPDISSFPEDLRNHPQ